MSMFTYMKRDGVRGCVRLGAETKHCLHFMDCNWTVNRKCLLLSVNMWSGSTHDDFYCLRKHFLVSGENLDGAKKSDLCPVTQ